MDGEMGIRTALLNSMVMSYGLRQVNHWGVYTLNEDINR